MKKIFILFFLFNFCFSTKIFAKILLRIIGGNIVTEKKYPWIGSLMYKDRREHFCGSSLIADGWLVTAAHCVKSQSYSNTRAFLNILDKNENNEGEIEIFIDEIIPHEQYNGSTYVNDIALLKLTETSKNKIKDLNVEKVKLISTEQIGVLDKAEAPVTVAGWGKTDEYAPEYDYSPILLEADLQIRGQEDCISDYSINNIFDSSICAYDPTWWKDSCTGDSGGPLFAKNDQEEILIGIVSWAEGCAQPGFPGVYARVSSFLNWIEEKTGIDFSQENNSQSFTETHIFNPGWHLFSLPGKFFEK